MTDKFKKQKGIKKIDMNESVLYNKYYKEWTDYMKKYYPEWASYPAYIWRGWGYMTTPVNQNPEDNENNNDSNSNVDGITDSPSVGDVGSGDSGGGSE